jgi:hypothetical protein
MMPPHTNAVPKRDGDTLVIEGYSLNYTDPAEELSVKDAQGADVPFEATLTKVREDRSDGAEDPPLGSIQYRCVITVTLGVPQDGRPLTVGFLGDVWTV